MFILRIRDGSSWFVRERDDVVVPEREDDPIHRELVAWIAGGNSPVVQLLPPSVPAEVPLWAAQAAMAEMGIYEPVNEFITARSQTDPAMFMAWTMGNVAIRNSSLIKANADALGVTPEQLDALFTRAAELSNR